MCIHSSAPLPFILCLPLLFPSSSFSLLPPSLIHGSKIGTVMPLSASLTYLGHQYTNIWCPKWSHQALPQLQLHCSTEVYFGTRSFSLLPSLPSHFLPPSRFKLPMFSLSTIRWVRATATATVTLPSLQTSVK